MALSIWINTFSFFVVKSYFLAIHGCLTDARVKDPAASAAFLLVALMGRLVQEKNKNVNHEG
ncbi:hypothetical protein [Neobacillus sp. 19]|uniref:hypothetical protein n=1 Tax=Neobacillus sp. 19 TaxID=3394458 RepID=UPI003BF66220